MTVPNHEHIEGKFYCLAVASTVSKGYGYVAKSPGAWGWKLMEYPFADDVVFFIDTDDAKEFYKKEFLESSRRDVIFSRIKDVIIVELSCRKAPYVTCKIPDEFITEDGELNDSNDK